MGYLLSRQSNDSEKKLCCILSGLSPGNYFETFGIELCRETQLTQLIQLNSNTIVVLAMSH